MSATTPSPSAPLKNPVWEAFAQNVASGMKGGPGLLAAAPHLAKTSAKSRAFLLLRRVDVASRVQALRLERAADAAEVPTGPLTVSAMIDVMAEVTTALQEAADLVEAMPQAVGNASLVRKAVTQQSARAWRLRAGIAEDAAPTTTAGDGVDVARIYPKPLCICPVEVRRD